MTITNKLYTMKIKNMQKKINYIEKMLRKYREGGIILNYYIEGFGASKLYHIKTIRNGKIRKITLNPKNIIYI